MRWCVKGPHKTPREMRHVRTSPVKSASLDSTCSTISNPLHLGDLPNSIVLLSCLIKCKQSTKQQTYLFHIMFITFSYFMVFPLCFEERLSGVSASRQVKRQRSDPSVSTCGKHGSKEQTNHIISVT